MWYLWKWHYRGQNVICSLSFLNVTFYNPNGKFWHICLNAFYSNFLKKVVDKSLLQHLIGSFKTKLPIEPMDSLLGTNFHKTTTSKIQKRNSIKKISAFLEKNLQNFKNLVLEKACHISTQCLVLRQILINFGQCFLQNCCQLVPNLFLGCL